MDATNLKKPLIPIPSVSTYTNRLTGKSEIRTHMAMMCGDCGGRTWHLTVKDAVMDHVSLKTNMKDPTIICAECGETYDMNVRV